MAGLILHVFTPSTVRTCSSKTIQHNPHNRSALYCLMLLFLLILTQQMQAAEHSSVSSNADSTNNTNISNTNLNNINNTNHTALCQFQRGLIGAELLGIINRDKRWQVGSANRNSSNNSNKNNGNNNKGNNSNQAFNNNLTTNFFTSTVLGCQFTEQLKFTAQPSLQLVINSQKPGELEGELHEYLLLLNEAKLSAEITLPSEENDLNNSNNNNSNNSSNSIYLDAGKLRLHSGYLFGYSPLHLLRTISGDLKSVPVSGYSNDAKDFYNEGIYGVNTSFYQDSGTFQFALFPKLTRHLDLNQPVTELNHFARTNGLERYYASYTSSGMSDYHTTAALLLGTQQKAALGVSRIFADKWIFSAETALLNGQTWQHFDADHAHSIKQFQFVGQPFNSNNNRIENEIALGLRYTTDSNSEVGAEFFYQSQGYSKETWRTFFETLDFINGGYQTQLPFEIPSIRQAYQDYSRLFASQLDNVRRNGYLLDKSYLTLYAQNNQEGFHALNWSLSSQINLRDYSTALDAQINMLLNDNMTAFTGVKSALGKQESEFALFGDRLNLYMGLQLNW